ESVTRALAIEFAKDGIRRRHRKLSTRSLTELARIVAPESMSNAAAPDFVVHDFVHRRRAYSGLCGSCVRIFAISYVESVGVYRSTPPASNLLKVNGLETQEKNITLSK